MAEQSSLDRLPSEVYLVYLLPYLNRYDIFALREVNRYLNIIFTDNKCWEKFVQYPEKYFLCDLKSRSTVEGVAEVLQDISQQDGRHKWWGYYKLQVAHLRNWGVTWYNQYNTISLSIRYMGYMEEMVDDNNEHWVCFIVHNTLEVWNITAQPQGPISVTVGPHSLVRLLPCMKVLVKGEEGCMLAVYELLPEASTVQLRFLFRFDEEMARHDRDIGRDAGDILYSLYFRFIVMNQIFIGYLCQLSIPQDHFLHLWNLDENRKLNKTSLEVVINVFVNHLSTNGVNMIGRYHLNLFEGEYPYIVVVIKHSSNQIRFSQINLFNINSNQFTHLVGQTSSEVLCCCMFHSKIAVNEKVPSGNNFYPRICVYSVPSEVGQTVHLRGQLLYEWSVVMHNNLYNIVLKQSKIFIKTNNELIIIMTDPALHQLTMPMDDGFKILGFIEPKILLMYDSYKDSTDTVVRVYNILNKRLIRSWEHVNTDSSRFHNYFTNLVYPSKLILNIENRDQFRVYNF